MWRRWVLWPGWVHPNNLKAYSCLISITCQCNLKHVSLLWNRPHAFSPQFSQEATSLIPSSLIFLYDFCVLECTLLESPKQDRKWCLSALAFCSSMCKYLILLEESERSLNFYKLRRALYLVISGVWASAKAGHWHLFLFLSAWWLT